jgi:hypothetical protein
MPPRKKGAIPHKELIRMATSDGVDLGDMEALKEYYSKYKGKKGAAASFQSAVYEARVAKRDFKPNTVGRSKKKSDNGHITKRDFALADRWVRDPSMRQYLLFRIDQEEGKAA